MTSSPAATRSSRLLPLTAQTTGFLCARAVRQAAARRPCRQRRSGRPSGRSGSAGRASPVASLAAPRSTRLHGRRFARDHPFWKETAHHHHTAHRQPHRHRRRLPDRRWTTWRRSVCGLRPAAAVDPGPRLLNRCRAGRLAGENSNPIASQHPSRTARTLLVCQMPCAIENGECRRRIGRQHRHHPARVAGRAARSFEPTISASGVRRRRRSRVSGRRSHCAIMSSAPATWPASRISVA